MVKEWEVENALLKTYMLPTNVNLACRLGVDNAGGTLCHRIRGDKIYPNLLVHLTHLLIIYPNPFNKVCITHTQPNAINYGKTQSTHLPNNFIYVYDQNILTSLKRQI